MSGSQAHYEALAGAWARYLLAEAEFDAQFTPATARAADDAFLAAVTAAVRCDPMALRSPSISDWITVRLRTYRSFAPGR